MNQFLNNDMTWEEESKNLSNEKDISRFLSKEHELENQSITPIKERYPILFVDVNLGENDQERLTVYEGETPKLVST